MQLLHLQVTEITSSAQFPVPLFAGQKQIDSKNETTLFLPAICWSSTIEF